jgi:YegS/Rv2252/BmrU family lipid kinase
MQRNLLYFINPISGTKNKQALVELIHQETTNHNISYQIVHTNKEGDYQYLPDKIENENISDVIICGGDGTISQIVSFLLNTNVNIGIIPVGSGNGLAFAANISRDFKKAMQIIFAGTAKYIDGFSFNNKFGCMLAGFGFDAKVAHDFSKQKKRGLITYILLCIKNFFSIKSYSFTIEINQQKIKTNALFISIANSNQFGNHVTIAPMASLNDSLFDVVVVNKMNKLITMLSLIRQISVGKIKSDIIDKNKISKGIGYFHCDKITIENHDNAPMHLDGEPIATENKIEIKIIPSAFKLLQPC